MIKPTYDPNFEFDDKGLAHSYPNHPPKYSEPEILYSFYYDGFMTNIPGLNVYTWEVTPPFYIVSGQGTSTITIELMPQLIKDRERIITGDRLITYRDINHSDINLNITNSLKNGTFSESTNVYYRQGPLWKITGNKNPKLITNGKYKQVVETYTLIPQYNMTGQPPKNLTNPESYKFDIKNGKVLKVYGENPPNGNPLVDILWYSSGDSYLSFYSTWIKESVLFPNTLSLYVSE